MSFEDDFSGKLELNGVEVREEILKLRTELGFDNTKLSELWAFASYMCASPKNFLALVDTFDTMNSGVKNFIICAIVLQWHGGCAKGIWLDSGDLAGLSIKAKQFFKEVGDRLGLEFKFIVVASNDINERVIKKLNEEGHSIDVFGIGTNLVTCQA